MSTETETTRDDAIRSAHSVAVKRLIDEHRDEFHGYKSEEAKRLGFDWQPRKTEEQKAEEQFQHLLTQYPHLAQQVAAEAGTGPAYAAPTPDSGEPQV